MLLLSFQRNSSPCLYSLSCCVYVTLELLPRHQADFCLSNSDAPSEFEQPQQERGLLHFLFLLCNDPLLFLVRNLAL